MKRTTQKGFRILLISASFEKEWRSPTINKNSHYPLGLGYLHAYLENKGHNVNTLFLNDYSFDQCFKEVLRTIADIKPEITGFNILTNNRVSSFRIIEYIHRNCPGIRILIGGIHATLMYRQIITKFPFIIAVLGEGKLLRLNYLKN